MTRTVATWVGHGIIIAGGLTLGLVLLLCKIFDND